MSQQHLLSAWGYQDPWYHRRLDDDDVHHRPAAVKQSSGQQAAFPTSIASPPPFQGVTAANAPQSLPLPRPAGRR